jgi:hypothetical protein
MKAALFVAGIVVFVIGCIVGYLEWTGRKFLEDEAREWE